MLTISAKDPPAAFEGTGTGNADPTKRTTERVVPDGRTEKL